MPKRRRVMRHFKIDEISAVDRPAQEGARAVIMKRDDAGDGLAKGTALTTEINGHAHLVTLVTFESEQRNSGQTSYDDEHSHPWIRTADGEIVIGASDGHSHDVGQMSKSKASDGAGTKEEDDTMPKTTEEQEGVEALKAATDRNAELETELAEANARAEMTDVEKAHLDGLDPQLDDDARKAFFAAKPGERVSIVAKAVKAEEDARGVAYKADDGTEYTKADDPRLVGQARRSDELARRLEKTTKRADEQDLRKRAEEDLKHLPGTVETRMALLKAAESIEDGDERKAALEALKAQNEQLGKAFKTLGSKRADGEVPAGGDEGNPQGQLDELAKRYAKDKDVTEAEGYDAVLQTEEGSALYSQVTGDAQYVN